jgi:hypothetical protein
MNPPSIRRDLILPVLAGVVVLVAATRIIATHRVFSGTFDEPAHVAAGMEWLDRGQFTYEPMNPPLARVAVAVGPYAAGIRSFGSPNRWREGSRILYADGAYSRNLALARLGVLPFFFVAAVVVWLWARRLFGAPTAALAAVLVATLPPMLAHGGLATTDMALAALLTATIYAFMRWLDARTVEHSLALGLAAGLTILAKFSALAFLPAAGGAILAVRWWARRAGDGSAPVTERPGSAATAGNESPQEGAGRRRVATAHAAAIAAAAAWLVIWAGYRFSFHSLEGSPPLPAVELWQGIAHLVQKAKIGHETYLFGEISTRGWWWFFPITLAVKTPLPFVALTVIGGVGSLELLRGRRDWQSIAPLVAAVAIVVVTLPPRLNIGLRHVLPVYPLAAVIAGYGVTVLWRATRARTAQRALAVGLLLWQLAGTWRAHPDYLPWFNELAGGRPERILVNADLDWGQDLLRLADTVEALGIDSLALAYYGSANPARHFPRVRPMAPFERPEGWFAVSVAVIKGLHVPDWTGFEWLESVEPAAHVGESIRLYHSATADDDPVGN